MIDQPRIKGAKEPAYGHWILAFLILLAFGRGIWDLGGKSLWWDESLSVYRAEQPLISVLSNRITLTDNIGTLDTVDNHPPLYFLLLWAAVRLFGQSEFALRFLSLASVVLIVPLLYATGRRLVDGWAGLAAAALGALSPMYLWYGQETRMYTLLAFLSLLSFYSFVRAFYHPGKPLTVGRHRRWMVAFVAASLAVLFTHYLGILLVGFELLALGFIALWQTKSQRLLKGASSKSMSLTIAALLAALLPLLVYAWIILPRAAHVPGFHFVPLLDLVRDLLNSFSLGLSVDSDYWHVLLIDLIFLLWLLLGLAWLLQLGTQRTLRGATSLLAGYLLVPVAAIYLVSYIQPAYMNSRHLIFISPAFYLLVAVGLTRRRGRWLALTLPVGLVMLAGISYSTWNYFNEPAFDKDNHREWGAYLREHVRPGDVVVVEPPQIAELYEYYAGSDIPWVGLPLLNGSEQDTAAVLQDLQRQYDRVWLAYSHTPPWGDRGNFPRKWLTQNAFRSDYKPIHSYASSVFVACYLPSWPSVGRLPGDAEPLEVRYSSALRLAGYRLVSPPQPGKQLHVELFWAVDEPIPEEASVVLRLVDDNGHLWGQGEQCPYNGLYPMWQWQPNLLLRDEHELLIQPGTPPGTYQMELVLVSRPTEDGCLGARGDPIPPAVAPSSVSRGDRILLGSVQVQVPEEPASLDDLHIAGRQQARFGGLELLGSELAPIELEPGERLAVILYWQALEAPLPDAQFRLRLVDGSGDVEQEAVVRPAGDSYPSDQWQAGDRFEGQFWLRLPEGAPAGRYRLEVVPEPPLERTDAWATLRQWLGAASDGLRLGVVEVQAGPAGQIALSGTPVPLPTGLAISHPMVATLGEQVRFLGYDLGTDPARAAESLSLTLYWQALRPMDVSYTVFTHLLGPSNRIVGQKDSVPQGGAYPTTLWQPGEVIVDTVDLAIAPDAPPGSHPIEVGMYRLETRKRLPVLDVDGQPVPDDRILLPEVPVLPALTPTPAILGPRHRVYLPLVRTPRR
jgi:4-amino-4-deoxy-L-arabinose transferase-like glycosyltransferase